MIEIAEIVICAIKSILLKYNNVLVQRKICKSLIEKLIDMSNHSNKIK